MATESKMDVDVVQTNMEKNDQKNVIMEEIRNEIQGDVSKTVEDMSASIESKVQMACEKKVVKIVEKSIEENLKNCIEKSVEKHLKAAFEANEKKGKRSNKSGSKNENDQSKRIRFDDYVEEVDKRWKRSLISDGSRLESVQRRLLDKNADQNFGIILNEIKRETLEDMEKLKVEKTRMTIETEPKLKFMTCQYYQSGRCKQNVYSGLHLDKNHARNGKGFIHGCALCYVLAKGIVEHPLFECDLIKDLDEAAKAPGIYIPYLMVLKE